jgi:hypothetical protein
VPKFKKTSSSGGENRTAWRTPVKLPTAVSREPMMSLYSHSEDTVADSKSETAAAIETVNTTSPETATKDQPPGLSNLISEISPEESVKQTFVAAAQKRKKTDSKALTGTDKPVELVAPKRSEAEFLRLLKTEKMNFYSLAEILRGSSMALYCVLYSESLAKGAKGCQIRQTDLMMRAGINNPATLYKQERWLTALGLINKSVRLGNHGGASYEVNSLEILPLPEFLLAQFDSYLSEYRG